MISFMAGQGVDRIALDDSKNGILARELQLLSEKIIFLESQLGQSYVEPNYEVQVLASLDSLKTEAFNLYYVAYRAEVVSLIDEIIEKVLYKEYIGAIAIIDYLIGDKNTYFYSGYKLRKRTMTVSRFESIKVKLGA